MVSKGTHKALGFRVLGVGPGPDEKGFRRPAAAEGEDAMARGG